jgi:hypothetical protein
MHRLSMLLAYVKIKKAKEEVISSFAFLSSTEYYDK